ncbi:MAG: MFS transporter [Bifidobacteriaceae bacterium]|nr:MFS transporter [Bifidobacteriaceae bacterium]MCI1914708.1 MFS transporter [Bifidobacteriaceae bacterium]
MTTMTPTTPPPHPTSYRLTAYACFNGYIAQAVVNTFLPLLFITFTQTFGISIEELSILISANFFLQLLVDIFAGRYVDRIGYKTSIVAANALCATGLIMLSFMPFIMPSAFAGIIISVVVYAVGGGLIEVLISPIIEAIPSDNNDQMMSLLHSFYSWGQVGVVVVFVGFVALFGAGSWPILSLLFALIPAVSLLMFAKAPMPSIVDDDNRIDFVELLRRPAMWFFCLMLICAAAAELSMSQWSSAFAEAGLGVSKVVGDLAGPAAFAAMMGISRILYARWGERVDLRALIHWSATLCVVTYIVTAIAPMPALSLLACALTGLTVGIMAPGLMSLGAQKIPNGGTPMFSLFSFSQDVGGTLGPLAVGAVAGAFGDSLHVGLLFAAVFPLIMFIATVKKSVRHRMG